MQSPWLKVHLYDGSISKKARYTCSGEFSDVIS
jgi:hypothetical protein